MSADTELAFFCLLVRQGSLAATARELGLTPPAVSRRLALLEERLGVRLLHRTTRRLSMTSEGEVYFAHAQRDRKSTRLNSSHSQQSRMPSSA